MFVQDLVDELRRQRVLEERLPAAGDPRRPVLQRVLLQKRQSIEASLDQVKISQTTLFVKRAKKKTILQVVLLSLATARDCNWGFLPPSLGWPKIVIIFFYNNIFLCLLKANNRFCPLPPPHWKILTSPGKKSMYIDCFYVKMKAFSIYLVSM